MKKNRLNYFIIILLALLSGFFQLRNEYLYIFSFFLMVYFLLKVKNNWVSFLSITIFFIISTYWVFRALHFYYLILLIILVLFYGLLFYLYKYISKKFVIIILILFPLLEWLFIKIGYFPPILLSYELEDFFRYKMHIGFYGLSLLFAFFLYLIKVHKRGLYFVFLSLIIFLFIPKTFHYPRLKILKVNPNEHQSLVKFINGLKGYDGIILPEYIFRKDFQKNQEEIKNIFKNYFDNNGFLVFGFTKKRGTTIESWAGIMTKDKSLFVRKKHPVIFLEPRYKRIKTQNHLFIYKNYRLKLYVCQDYFFPDVQKAIKKNEIPIIPTYVPRKWGDVIRKFIDKHVNF